MTRQNLAHIDVALHPYEKEEIESHAESFGLEVADMVRLTFGIAPLRPKRRETWIRQRKYELAGKADVIPRGPFKNLRAAFDQNGNIYFAEDVERGKIVFVVSKKLRWYAQRLGLFTVKYPDNTNPIF